MSFPRPEKPVLRIPTPLQSLACQRNFKHARIKQAVAVLVGFCGGTVEARTAAFRLGQEAMEKTDAEWERAKAKLKATP